MKPSTKLGCTLAGVLVLASALPAHALTMDTVTVGNPGNPNDQDYGEGAFGAVATTYAIGKYEVTLNQYAEFLNAVAATDTYALYNPNMGTDLNVAGISRLGSSGSYTYGIIGSGARPVTYVSWLSAARFTNWLHNGQPSGLGQVAASTEQGAYTLNGDISSGFETRNANAEYWIPSENEWYKAAYHQPVAAGGDADGYWLFPTGSNSIPNSRNGSLSDPNSANFYHASAESYPSPVNGGYAVTGWPGYEGTQNYLTDVGAFAQADSYYGTFDQAGNVSELTDTLYGPGPNRIVRGGFWMNDFIFEGTYLSASGREAGVGGDQFTGFRVASVVPEPSSALLMLGSGAIFLLRRRRAAAL